MGGAGTITNVSGNGNTLTLYSWGGATTIVAGKYNQGLSFPGGACNMQASYIGNPDGSIITSWTDSVWVNYTAAQLARSEYIIYARLGSLDAYGGSYGFDSWVTSTGVVPEIFGVASNGGMGWIDSQQKTPFNFQPNTWYMITQTVTTGQYNVYVNGQFIGGTALNSSYTPQLMKTAAQNGGNPVSFALGAGDMWGTLDDFYLYNTALTPSQIQTLYQGQTLHGLALPVATPVQVAAGATLDLAATTRTSTRWPIPAAAGAS